MIVRDQLIISILNHKDHDALGKLTRYSKTRVRLLSVWIMSCSVTILACFRSFNNDTGERERHTHTHTERQRVKQRDREIRGREKGRERERWGERDTHTERQSD